MKRQLPTDEALPHNPHSSIRHLFTALTESFGPFWYWPWRLHREPAR